MKKRAKNFLCKLLVLFMTVMMGLEGNIDITFAASVTDRVPIICYALSTGRVSTYRSAGGSYSGYIDGRVDQIRILNVYENGWSRVKYPISNGYKTAYTKSSNLFCNTKFSTDTTVLGQRKTVYRRSNLSQSLGTVYADDKVIIVGTSGNNTQIIFPVSGRYKMGWISGEYDVSGRNNEADISNGTYVFQSALDDNKVMDAYGASAVTNGTNIQLYSYKGGENQKYTITHVGNGWYKIICKWGNKSLDVHGGVVGNEVNVELYDWHGGDNQLWKFIPAGDGYYYIQSKLGYYLDVWNSQKSNETNIQTYQFNGGKNQKWKLEGELQDTASWRTTVVNYMTQMATIEWTPSVSFRHWSYGQAGGNNMYWSAGCTYYGIPYSQYSRNTNLELFKNNLKGKKYVGLSGQRTYLGSDCSSAVSMAYQQADPQFGIYSTYDMFPVSGIMRMVGNYNHCNTNSASEICANNGKSVMQEAYRHLQAGDLVVNDGHVMMVMGNTGSSITVIHQTTYDSSLHSTWRVNESYTYNYLFNYKYIPVTNARW